MIENADFIFKKIQTAFEQGKISWRQHALARMLERNISRKDVFTAIKAGNVIESYPESKPYPGLLIAYVDENGLIRGEGKANQSNIIGKKPEFKVLVESGKNILVLAESIAYNVTRGDVHNMAQVADQRADGRYDFKTKMMGGVEILDLDTRRLPNLESVAVPTGYASIPEEVKEFNL